MRPASLPMVSLFTFVAAAAARLCDCHAAEAPDPRVEAEVAKLRGPWNVVRGEADKPGRRSQPSIFQRAVVFLTPQWPAPADVYSFRVNPAKSPAQIDLETRELGGTPRRIEGIYRWEGDRLKMLLAFPGWKASVRPTAFGAEPAEDQFPATLERADPAEGELAVSQGMPSSIGPDTIAWREFRDDAGRIAVTLRYSERPEARPRNRLLRETDLYVRDVQVHRYDAAGKEIWRSQAEEKRPAFVGTLSDPVVRNLLNEERLSIRGGSDGDLKPLARLPKLRHLDLLESSITNAGLVHLRAVPSLESLSLGGKGIAHGALAELHDLPQLRELVVIGAALGDEDLAAFETIAALRELRSLRLEDMPIADAGISHLKTLSSLRSLDLMGLGLTDAGLVHLKDLRGLERLNLSRMPLDGSGLAHLSELRSLKTLLLESTRARDAALAHLTPLTALETLYLGSTPITDAGLRHLKGLANLRHLNLSLTSVTAAGLKTLREALPKCGIQHHKSW